MTLEGVERSLEGDVLAEMDREEAQDLSVLER